VKRISAASSTLASSGELFFHSIARAPPFALAWPDIRAF
jgi:hypothetical protein